MWVNLPLDMDQLTPYLGQVEPFDHFFLTSHIFMALSHNCLLIISNDRKHSEICLDVLILQLSHFFWLPGQLKQKVVQLTPFSSKHELVSLLMPFLIYFC